MSLLITSYFFFHCDYFALSKQSICNDPYLISFQYIQLIKQMKEMWRVNCKVTFSSKHPALQRTKRKNSVPVAACSTLVQLQLLDGRYRCLYHRLIWTSHTLPQLTDLTLSSGWISTSCASCMTVYSFHIDLDSA